MGSRNWGQNRGTMDLTVFMRTTPTNRGSARPGKRAAAVPPAKLAVKVVRGVTIRQPAKRLYSFWRDVTNLAQVVHHPVTITSASENVSHWSVSGPLGRAEWDSVIINDEPDALIVWQSVPGGDVDHAGSVAFRKAPGDEGTEVIVTVEYDPPGGKLGAAVAKFTRDSAGSQVYDALRRLKALMEAGEIPTTEGQPAGGPRRQAKGQR